ncbi:hypothetical protein [Micromonospora sp. NPDC005324]|uniref:hypothetical protein n=1 Tax=Micromonospora sp. NPDC005324 TaxID=3157033 RepID=UPI0033A93906
MTISLENQLQACMRDEVAGLSFTRDVLAEANRRHRRRTALHRTAYAAGVVGVAGALIATLTVNAAAPTGTNDAPGAVAERPSSANIDTAQMRLAAAAAASENISYRVKVTTTIKDKLPAEVTLPGRLSRSWVTEGAFDPRTTTGYLESPYKGELRPYVAARGFSHERLVNGVRYVGSADGLAPDSGKIIWTRYPGKRANIDFGLALGEGITNSADPQALFRTLRQAGAKITETSGGTYRFEVQINNVPLRTDVNLLVGEVALDADRRIARMVYDRTAIYSVYDEVETLRLKVEIALSDYGAPVEVEPPANARFEPSPVR